jgi:hypothetical protein
MVDLDIIIDPLSSGSPQFRTPVCLRPITQRKQQQPQHRGKPTGVQIRNKPRGSLMPVSSVERNSRLRLAVVIGLAEMMA